MSSIKRRILLIGLAAFVAGIMFTGGCLLVNDLHSGDKKNSPLPDNQAGAGQAVPGVHAGTIAAIVKEAGPAVVKVNVEKVSQGSSRDPFWDDPFFRYFFNAPSQQPRTQVGMGSGFIISDDGYIITNEHVISGADKITITMQDNDKEYPAKLIGADYDLDLAIIKIEAGKKLPHLVLGDSDQIEVGNWVVAIGNPFGFDHTVTVGVISAKGRPVPVEGRYYKNLLQTDAAINPGNSGGPLLNLEGEVVGINTAVAQAQGIGFAISTNTVKEVQQDLLQKGKVTRPWLGIQMEDLTPELAQYFGLKSQAGVVVVGVVPGSPAEKAGLRQRDVILKIDNKQINNAQQLSERVQQARVGDKMLLTVYRQQKTVEITVQVGERPAQFQVQ